MNIEKMKQEILKLIDESKENGRKIAFYSDPNVTEILTKLYEQWEKNNRKGIPLDYASPEEIEILYNLALKYSKVSDAEAWSMFLRENIYEKSQEDKKKTFLRR
ncbi:MAG: hypothetical protein J7L82_05910, partial [Staphylothermus sp.]|nr:hypothetical protein [Staphylothermus sp.]